MALLTWLEFKAETKKLLSDTTATDDLFASACAAYVKSMICREVDHDLLLSKSYWNYFTEMRRRLLGYSTTLVVGGTLDTAVRVLLPVDGEREGIQDYLTQQIKNAYQELTGLAVFIEKVMREIVIDFQSYVPCCRVGRETIYTEENVVNVGTMSRAPMPEQGEIRDAYYLTDVDELAEEVEFEAGDLVASNGNIYTVLVGGQLEVGELEDGLVTTDGSLEELGSLSFAFAVGGGCLRSKIVPMPWSDRFEFNKLRTGCHGDTEVPALLAIDRESYSFFVWPKLDETHRVVVYWTGLKFTFLDADLVPFDETLQQAVREGVLAKYYLQVENDARQSALHDAAYSNLRTRAYLDCRSRQMIEYGAV